LEVCSKVKHKILKILDLLVKLTNSHCYTTGLKRKIFDRIKANAIGGGNGIRLRFKAIRLRSCSSNAPIGYVAKI